MRRAFSPAGRASLRSQERRHLDKAKPNVPLTEREQWEYAALLLHEFGEKGILDHVASAYDACLSANDQSGADHLLSLIDKLDRLIAASHRDGKSN